MLCICANMPMDLMSKGETMLAALRSIDQPQVENLSSLPALQTLRKADRTGIADDTSGSGARNCPTASNTCFPIPPWPVLLLERGSIVRQVDGSF